MGCSSSNVEASTPTVTQQAEQRPSPAHPTMGCSSSKVEASTPTVTQQAEQLAERWARKHGLDPARSIIVQFEGPEGHYEVKLTSRPCGIWCNPESPLPIIAGVAPRSQAAFLGVKVADRVCSIDGKKVHTLEDMDAVRDQTLSRLPEVDTEIFQLKGVDAGRAAWYVVAVDKRKVAGYKECLGHEQIHLEDHGEVLESAFGDDMPVAVWDKLYGRKRPAVGDSVMILVGESAGRVGVVSHDDGADDNKPYRVLDVGDDRRWWKAVEVVVVGSAGAQGMFSTGASRQSSRECAICCVTKAAKEFSGQITKQCNHERDVCRECVARTIELEVNGKGNVTLVRCPREGCGSSLSHADVKREASAEVFASFDNLLLQQCLQESPGFRWCAHNGCGSGQLVATDVGPNTFFTCHHCRKRSCAHHRCVWHAGRTCQQYDKDAANSDEVALLQYLEQEGTARCPKCHHGIQKTAGCDHMTCSRQASGCGHEFCYRCGADYNAIRRRGNHAHQSGCPHYRPPQ